MIRSNAAQCQTAKWNTTAVLLSIACFATGQCAAAVDELQR